VRILILGGDGMLGHQLLKHFQKNNEVKVTLRKPLASYTEFKLFSKENTFENIEAANFLELEKRIKEWRPEAILNAVGIVKQRPTAHDIIPSLEINSLLPHKLSVFSRDIGARLVHMSTDCVFSGKKGNYTEKDPSDAEDIYGKTKFLGEVHESGITLRTSIIGLELSRKTGLIEWFLAQKGSIRGFTKAIYTGFTTQEMSRIIESLLVDYPKLSGVWQVASGPINKFELLKLFALKLEQQGIKQDIKIEAFNEFVCDRSLSQGAFEEATGYVAPSWESMLEELAIEVRERRGMWS